jgi:hypothetical protein
MADNTYTIPELDQIGSIDIADLLIIEDVSLDKTFKTSILTLFNPLRLNKQGDNIGIGYNPNAQYKFGVSGASEFQGDMTAANISMQQLIAAGAVTFSNYGSGNNILNTAPYLLAVDSNGDLKEVELSVLSASDNLGDHTATESLNLDSQSIVNALVLKAAVGTIRVKNSADEDIFVFGETSEVPYNTSKIDFIAEDDLFFTKFGDGTLLDNSSPYLLGVTSSGTVKEVEFSAVSPIVIQNEVSTGDPLYTSIKTIGFDIGQLKVGKEYGILTDLARVELPNGDFAYPKMMVINRGDNTADADMIENKVNYLTANISDAWQKAGVLQGVSSSDRNLVFSTNSYGTTTIGPNHSISPSDRIDADDIVKSSLFVGSSAVAPFSSSDSQLVIADGQWSERGDRMISMTNLRSFVFGAVPSKIFSQKEPNYTFDIKDGYTCIVEIEAITKVDSVGDSSLSIGDVCMVQAKYIVDNNSGVISTKKVGSDSFTALGLTTLELATSISTDPTNKTVSIFITATNLGTNGSALGSVKANFTWIK